MQGRTAGGVGWGRAGWGRVCKPEGAMGAAMQVEQPTQRGRVSKWGSCRNGGGQCTFCTPCLCGKVGVVGRWGRESGAGRRGIKVVVVVATATSKGWPACAQGEEGWMRVPWGVQRACVEGRCPAPLKTRGKKGGMTYLRLF